MGQNRRLSTGPDSEGRAEVTLELPDLQLPFAATSAKPWWTCVCGLTAVLIKVGAGGEGSASDAAATQSLKFHDNFAQMFEFEACWSWQFFLVFKPLSLAARRGPVPLSAGRADKYS